jgi:hypothetical protein
MLFSAETLQQKVRTMPGAVRIEVWWASSLDEMVVHA